MGDKVISVITVVYNDVENIERSLLDTIAQSYKDLELIVIDGGSTDGTVDVLKKYSSKIIWLSEKDKGIYDAMNKGAKIASGEWILYHNCGDFFSSNESISEMFKTGVNEDVCVLYGNCRFVNNYGYIDRIPPLSNPGYDLHMMPVFHPAAFIRTSYQKSHSYDLSYKSSADYDFFIKCLKEGGKFEYRPTLVTNYSYGDGMSVANWLTVYKENRRVHISNGIHSETVFSFYLRIINTFLHNKAKKLLPKKFVENRMMQNLKKEGWILQ